LLNFEVKIQILRLSPKNNNFLPSHATSVDDVHRAVDVATDYYMAVLDDDLEPYGDHNMLFLWVRG